jgi:hypothetical protein
VLALRVAVAKRGRVMETKTPGQTLYEKNRHPGDPPWMALSKVERDHYEHLATEANAQPTPRPSPTGEPNPGKPPG